MTARILVVFPTAWDERQLAALPAAVRAGYELIFDEPRDAEVRWDLDVLAYIDQRVRTWRGRIDGVFSSSDYPGAIAAAAIALELGLPGAQPERVLWASHKYYSRQVQSTVAPAAVPRFTLFDPADERSWPDEHEFPCFVKPVKGSFSLFARRMDGRAALRAFAGSTALSEYRDYYVRLFDRLAARYARFEHGARAFLAEELLSGVQVTVEGWIQGGAAHVLGLVDTTLHPGTQSFASFDYPSHLPASVQARLGQTACTVATALGLDQTLFNVELFYEAAQDRIGLIEINPRLCGQFGDLYQSVDGVNGFQIALELASGARPTVLERAGLCAAAASVPLRLFRSARVARAPSPAEQRQTEAQHPHVLIWSDCQNGDEFVVGPDVEDGASVRYGVVNLGGTSRADIRERLATVERRLGFEFAPSSPALPRGSG